MNAEIPTNFKGLRVQEKLVSIGDKATTKRIISFLKKMELKYEENIEYSVILEQDKKIVGTGSVSGSILKDIAVDPEFHGEGLLAKILSLLIKEEIRRMRDPVFVLTKPKEKNKFKAIGFRELATVQPYISLLEWGSSGIDAYLKQLKNFRDDTVHEIASIVVNCNPFTLGHQFLVEQTAKENELVYIFVVTEDKSLFPTNVRLRLVREGTAHLKNVIVMKGGNYIISSVTFPSYFTRDENLTKVQGLLDAEIFGTYIAPTLKIKRRYVGTEPYCDATRQYNVALKSILPEKGIEVKEIERKTINGAPVSASTVRQFIREDKWKEIKKLVPPTTYNFLVSKEAKLIVEKIKTTSSKH